MQVHLVDDGLIRAERGGNASGLAGGAEDDAAPRLPARAAPRPQVGVGRHQGLFPCHDRASSRQTSPQREQGRECTPLLALRDYIKIALNNPEPTRRRRWAWAI